MSAIKPGQQQDARRFVRACNHTFALRDLYSRCCNMLDGQKDDKTFITSQGIGDSWIKRVPTTQPGRLNIQQRLANLYTPPSAA